MLINTLPRYVSHIRTLGYADDFKLCSEKRSINESQELHDGMNRLDIGAKYGGQCWTEYDYVT